MTLTPLQRTRQQLLRALARDHPGEHPYTLALRLQPLGHEITGKYATFLLNHDDDTFPTGTAQP